MATSAEKAKCERLKHALKIRTDEVESVAWEVRQKSLHPLRDCFGSGVYDPSLGIDQKRIEYHFSPVEHAEYSPLFGAAGSREMSMNGPGCAGNGSAFDVTGTGTSANCNVPQRSFDSGRNEFFREIKVDALGTRPECLLNLLQATEANQWFRQATEHIATEGSKQHWYQVERDYLKISKNFSVGVHGSEIGQFPGLPTGGADIGTFQQIEQEIRQRHGAVKIIWKGMSSASFDHMRKAYRAQFKTEVDYKVVESETFLEDGIKTVDFLGSLFQLNPVPSKGIITDNADNTCDLRLIRPDVAEKAQYGLQTGLQEGFFDCYINCGQGDKRLHEVVYCVIEGAANLLSFAPDSVGGHNPEDPNYNMSVNILDGYHLREAFPDMCPDPDGLWFALRAKDSVGFDIMRSNRMYSVIYQAASRCTDPVEVCCDSKCEGDKPIGIDTPPTTPGENCECDEQGNPVEDFVPTAPDLNNTDPGVLQFQDCGAITVPEGQEELLVYIERDGGYTGELTADAANTLEGTTLAVVSADGQTDGCYYVVPLAGTTEGQTFDLSLTGTNGTVIGCGAITVTIGPACTAATGGGCDCTEEGALTSNEAEAPAEGGNSEE